MDTINIFDISLANTTMDEAYSYMLKLIKNNKFHSIYTPNSEFILHARKDASYKNILIQSDLLLPDGMGVILCSKILRKPLKEKISGVDFVYKLLNESFKNPLSIYLLGSTQKNIDDAYKNIKYNYPKVIICGKQNGYFSNKEKPAIIQDIDNKKPDVLLVGLGSPKQEYFIHENKKKLKNVKVAIGVGGTIDILSKNKKLAPEFIRKSGFEWLYRTILEPKKRIRRVIKLPLILYLALYYRFKN